MSATFRFPYRVRAETSEAAIEAAKTQARAEGWTIRTLASCRQQPNGDWLVELAVYSDARTSA